jgi:hypothetical protein
MVAIKDYVTFRVSLVRERKALQVLAGWHFDVGLSDANVFTAHHTPATLA